MPAPKPTRIFRFVQADNLGPDTGMALSGRQRTLAGTPVR